MAKASRPEGRSGKGPVFEHLFNWRYDASGQKYPRYDAGLRTIPEEYRTVYLHEVVAAYGELGLKLGNQFAFTKDLLRTDSRNANWPARLKELKWKCVQVTGKGRNFKFVPYEPGQAEPFPDDCPLNLGCQIIPIQSVTLSVASKQIARLDEPRLMQIAVELRIIESHFALVSKLSRYPSLVLHIDHLQMGMKLSGAEIDGLFEAELGTAEQRKRELALITVEAKKSNEYVNLSQILAQIESASRLGVDYDMIVPVALKHRSGGVQIVEFAPFEKARDFSTLVESDLIRVDEAFYEVLPPIKSLGQRTAGTDETGRPFILDMESPDISENEDDG